MLSTCRQYFAKKVCFHVTPENAKTQEMGREDCLAANSMSTGLQQRNTDDHKYIIYYEIVQRTDKKQLKKRLGYCVHNVCIIKST